MWFPATLYLHFILAPQWPIVSVDHTLGFESASKSAISFSKSQTVSKGTVSPCAIWNGTGFLPNCWQEILSKKTGLVLTMAYYLSHIKTISVFSIVYVLPSWHFRTELYVYIRKGLLFCDLHQSSPILLLQTPRSFNDNFLGCVVQCHVESL